MPGVGSRPWGLEIRSWKLEIGQRGYFWKDDCLKMNRDQYIHRLQKETFDLCIIGGGASGAGCALDAALRGLKVALIEKTDFAAETSSKSTKLVHGGVRYLEQAFKSLDFAQLRQVQHGLEERHIVLQNAPHLARPLALITPVFNWWENLYFSIGLKLYDWFASRKDNLPKSRRLSKSDTLRRMPGLTRKIHSAVLYYDGQIDDARYCLALVQSAAAAGAIVSNHLEVIGFQKNEAGKLSAALVKDHLSKEDFTIKSNLFLNCTGPFADRVRQLANPGLTPRIRPSKGVHVILPHATLDSGEALLIPETRDGRVVFAIPFESELLLGTTDDEYNDLDKEPALLGGEVDFLLETLQPFLEKQIDRRHIKAGFGGLRPLVAPPMRERNGSDPGTSTSGKDASPLPVGGAERATKSLLRDHEVEHDGASNLLSLLGGKWTTYRLMAKDAVDVACKLLDIRAECRTATHLLVGAEGWDNAFWKKIMTDFGFDADISQHLAQKYGTRAVIPATLAAEYAELAERLIPGFPYLKAEVIYAVREEMACTIRDFLARRIRLEITDWEAALDAAPRVAKLMGDELGWTTNRQSDAAAAYADLLKSFQKMADTDHTGK